MVKSLECETTSWQQVNVCRALTSCMAQPWSLGASPCWYSKALSCTAISPKQRQKPRLALRRSTDHELPIGRSGLFMAKMVLNDNKRSSVFKRYRDAGIYVAGRRASFSYVILFSNVVNTCIVGESRLRNDTRLAFTVTGLKRAVH